MTSVTSSEMVASMSLRELQCLERIRGGEHLVPAALEDAEGVAPDELLVLDQEQRSRRRARAASRAS